MFTLLDDVKLSNTYFKDEISKKKYNNNEVRNQALFFYVKLKFSLNYIANKCR